ncbi:hypothetical protein SAICODRAFT_69753 [Saitoella complicata NRRL Y-17804]|uniref:Uncharacterized protein n=1 Tax=Saitoella complicata (strain BCRC 22490 / CBS 7301 / JCM 7358 / NBRC 10748 / NRRL Y-17804) TaxID=698492 RepID=A0A0E9NJY7_SAICN|nr:uncharacterized protein SAICODRAFT_69753 [Saitoella complicata NRRL Y-17804]ODQ55146.1 hypothetical protein SAICODRAFT_69753 [Saitoella complicata NRRL Y-17804]GAO49996.1 hypothetical protein G7K_4131-t1 [Saitoella complicata NRRL Y-17804]
MSMIPVPVRELMNNWFTRTNDTSNYPGFSSSSSSNLPPDTILGGKAPPKKWHIPEDVIWNATPGPHAFLVRGEGIKKDLYPFRAVDDDPTYSGDPDLRVWRLVFESNRIHMQDAKDKLSDCRRLERCKPLIPTPLKLRKGNPAMESVFEIGELWSMITGDLTKKEKKQLSLISRYFYEKFAVDVWATVSAQRIQKMTPGCVERIGPFVRELRWEESGLNITPKPDALFEIGPQRRKMAFPNLETVIGIKFRHVHVRAFQQCFFVDSLQELDLNMPTVDHLFLRSVAQKRNLRVLKLAQARMMPESNHQMNGETFEMSMLAVLGANQATLATFWTDGCSGQDRLVSPRVLSYILFDPECRIRDFKYIDHKTADSKPFKIRPITRRWIRDAVAAGAECRIHRLALKIKAEALGMLVGACRNLVELEINLGDAESGNEWKTRKGVQARMKQKKARQRAEREARANGLSEAEVTAAVAAAGAPWDELGKEMESGDEDGSMTVKAEGQIMEGMVGVAQVVPGPPGSAAAERKVKKEEAAVGPREPDEQGSAILAIEALSAQKKLRLESLEISHFTDALSGTTIQKLADAFGGTLKRFHIKNVGLRNRGVDINVNKVTWTVEDMENFCRACPELREFGIAEHGPEPGCLAGHILAAGRYCRKLEFLRLKMKRKIELWGQTETENYTDWNPLKFHSTRVPEIERRYLFPCLKAIDWGISDGNYEHSRPLTEREFYMRECPLLTKPFHSVQTVQNHEKQRGMVEGTYWRELLRKEEEREEAEAAEAAQAAHMAQ